MDIFRILSANVATKRRKTGKSRCRKGEQYHIPNQNVTEFPEKSAIETTN